MKLNSLKITLLAFVTMSVFSCKDNERKTNEALESAAEPSESAEIYEVDPSLSLVKWEGTKPGTTHYGTVTISEGTLQVNGDMIEAGNFNIDMNSITVDDLEGDDKLALEAHLKGTAKGKEGDFFNTAEYPTGTFVLTGVENNVVKGNLTLKGETRSVEFPATIIVQDNKLIMDTEKFNLDRTKWGINFMSKSIFSDLGDKFIGDDMVISIQLEAKKK